MEMSNKTKLNELKEEISKKEDELFLMKRRAQVMEELIENGVEGYDEIKIQRIIALEEKENSIKFKIRHITTEEYYDPNSDMFRIGERDLKPEETQKISKLEEQLKEIKAEKEELGIKKARKYGL